MDGRTRDRHQGWIAGVFEVGAEAMKKTLAEEIDETLRHAAGNITPEAKALLEQAKREALEREGLREIPCPDCYGGHFRPCQVCGDSGVAILRIVSPNESSSVTRHTERNKCKPQ